MDKMNAQNIFLNACRRDKQEVSIAYTDVSRPLMVGTIIAFDDEVIVFKHASAQGQHLIYKNQIKHIEAPIDVFTEENQRKANANKNEGV